MHDCHHRCMHRVRQSSPDNTTPLNSRVIFCQTKRSLPIPPNGGLPHIGCTNNQRWFGGLIKSMHHHYPSVCSIIRTETMYLCNACSHLIVSHFYMTHATDMVSHAFMRLLFWKSAIPHPSTESPDVLYHGPSILRNIFSTKY